MPGLKRKIAYQGGRYAWGAVARRRIGYGAATSAAGVSKKFMLGRAIGKAVGKAAPYLTAAYYGYKGARYLYRKVKKVQKSEGGDHPTQRLGEVDSCNIKLMAAGAKLKKPKNVMKGITRIHYVVGASLDSSSGKQAVEDILFMATRNQCLSSIGVNVSGATIPIGLFNCLTESIQGTNPQTLGFYSGRTQTQILGNYNIFLNYVTVCMDVLNASNFPVSVDLYFNHAKGNFSNGSLDYWIYNEEPYYTAVATSQTGTAAVNATINSPDRNSYGIKPNSSKDFTQNWKSKCVKSLLLAAGATQQIKFNVVFNRVLNFDKINEQGSNVQKNLTHSIMAVARGQICDTPTAITGSNQDSSTVTWSSCQVKFLNRITYAISRMKQDSIKETNQNIFSSTARTDAPLADQQAINPASLVAQSGIQV